MRRCSSMDGSSTESCCIAFFLIEATDGHRCSVFDPCLYSRKGQEGENEARVRIGLEGTAASSPSGSSSALLFGSGSAPVRFLSGSPRWDNR
ncbi:hypothetical protein ACFWMU_09870 [Streptomyces sp. NPDC058357]|uniref:hypothetical protein n=1 Tax=unclassified Streptomyces TaxID=2593676 RepID=UPI0036648585